MAEKTVEQLKREFEELSDIAKEMEKDLKDTEDSAKSMVDSVLSFGEKLLGSFGEANSLAAEQLEIQNDIAEAQKETNEAKQRALNAEVEYNKAAGKTSEEQKKQLDQLKKQNEKIDERRQKTEEQTRSVMAQNQVYSASSDVFESIAVRLGISKSESAGLAKNMYSSWRLAVKQDGIIKGTLKSIVSIGKALWDAFSPVNLISSAMSAIFKASVEFLFRSSEAISNFSAAAGDAGAMARDVGAAMSLGTGVNIEQASQAASGLAASWQDFASASREARISMIRTTAELGRLGIGAEQVGGSISLLTKGMGMSIEQAEDMMKGMASAAVTLGTTPAKLASDFASASASLALYGGRMEQEFYDLAAAAKASGLEIQELVALGEAFDSFEEGSAKAGQLNALLGGPFLDSLELMRLQAEEGPDAVAGALKDAFESAGKTFEDMSYMERKAYAQTLGLSADKFAKLMGYESDEAKAAAKAAKRDADTQKRYQSMLRSTLSLAERIRNFFQAVFVKGGVAAAIRELIGVLMGSQKGAKSVTDMLAGPMVSAIKFVTEVTRELVKRFNGEVAPALTRVGEAFINFFSDGANDAAESGKSFATTVVDSVVEFLGSLEEGMKSLKLWWQDVSQWFSDFGGMIAERGARVLEWFDKYGIWVGIAAAATAVLAIVVMGFIQSTGWMMIGILALITTSLVALSEVLKQTGAAFEAFGDIFTKMGDGISAVGRVVGELFQMFRDASLIEGLTFGKFLKDTADGIEALADSASKIKSDKFDYLSKLMISISLHSANAAKSTNAFAMAVNSLATALAGIPSDKFGQFSMNLTRTLQATSQVTPESARGAVEVIEKAKEYQQEVVRNKDNVDALAEILKATGAAQPAGAGGQTVIRLELGGTVLDQYIWDSVNNTLNRTTR